MEPLNTAGYQFRHWPLAIISIIFIILALTYSLVLPLGEGSDETAHFALVRFIAEHKRPPLTLEEQFEVGYKGDASPYEKGNFHFLSIMTSTDVEPAKHLIFGQVRVLDPDRMELPENPIMIKLGVGMYILQTGERLQAVDPNGQPLPDNAIQLATLTLKNNVLQ